MDLAREALGNSRRYVIPLALLSVVSVIGTVAAPVLTHTPLLLIALSPRLPFLAMAAGQVSSVPFLLVAVPRLLLADPVYFLFGRNHGAAALAALPGAKGRLARIAAVSAPLLVLLRPVGRHVALAGAGRSRWWLVALADLASTVVYVATIHAAGVAVT